jgi:hypothetical protein
MIAAQYDTVTKVCALPARLMLRALCGWRTIIPPRSFLEARGAALSVGARLASGGKHGQFKRP